VFVNPGAFSLAEIPISNSSLVEKSTRPSVAIDVNLVWDVHPHRQPEAGACEVLTAPAFGSPVEFTKPFEKGDSTPAHNRRVFLASKDSEYGWPVLPHSNAVNPARRVRQPRRKFVTK
jgi:hypothetical protein